MDEYQLLEEIDPAEVIQDTDKLVGTSGATAKNFSFGLIKQFLAELFVKKEDVKSEGIKGSDDPVSSDALYQLELNLENYKAHLDEWLGDIHDELDDKSEKRETVQNVRYEDGTFYQEIDGNEQEICTIEGIETVDAVTAGNMNAVTSNAVANTNAYFMLRNLADGVNSFYSQSANDIAYCGGRSCKRTSAEPCVWFRLVMGTDPYEGWLCIGLTESAVTCTATSEYGGTNKGSFTDNGIKFYWGVMANRFPANMNNDFYFKIDNVKYLPANRVFTTSTSALNNINILKSFYKWEFNNILTMAKDLVAGVNYVTMNNKDFVIVGVSGVAGAFDKQIKYGRTSGYSEWRISVTEAMEVDISYYFKLL